MMLKRYLIQVLLLIVFVGCGGGANLEQKATATLRLPTPMPQPEEHRIIYVSEGKYWAMDEDGQNRRVIWTCVSGSPCETMAPDWQRGVYMEKGEEVWNLRLREQEQQEGPILMADTPQKDTIISWSPDGKHVGVLFYRFGWEAVPDNELYVIDVESKEDRLIDKGIIGFLWSPDSKQIALYDDSVEYFGLYVEDVERGERQTVIEGELIEGWNWSPDSQNLAIAMTTPENDTTVFVSDLTDNTLFKIPDIKQYDYYTLANTPFWSQDKERLAYVADYRKDGSEKIYYSTLFVHNFASGKQIPLTEDVLAGRLWWSPDNQKIIYQSNQDYNYYTINIETGDITKILDEGEGGIISWE